MELRQLRHFATVAQQGNFSRAARKSNLTQPALSRQVKNLEEELGLILLKRRENGASLTPAGIVFLEDAREILAQMDRAVSRVRKKATEKPLRVGYVPAFVAGIMAGALSRFKETGLATPELFDLTSQEIVSKANGGELDVAILGKELESKVPNFQWTTLRQLSPILVMPKQHPLAKTKKISPSVLNDYPVHGLSPVTFPDYAPRLRAMLRPFGIKPVLEDQSADGAPALFHLLEAHNALAVLSEGASRLLTAGLTMRPFDPSLPLIPIGVGLTEASRNEQAEAFVKILHEAAQSHRRRRN
jgi:LysR family transcriptional regulator, benzoate and cis,cis-muconate-responsive activator of ben and cat genes